MDVKKPIAIRSWVHSLANGATFYIYTAREAYVTTKPVDTSTIFRPGGLFIGDKLIAYDGIVALSETPISWQGGGGGGGATILNDLTDVQTGVLADNDILQYDSVSSTWKNVAGNLSNLGGMISGSQHGDQSGAGAVTQHVWSQVAGKPVTYPPSAHALTHKSAGSDEVLIDELGTGTNNTNLNATTTEHGLLPRLSGNASLFLKGDGTWGAAAGGGDVVGPTLHANNYIPQWDGIDTKALKEGIDPASLEVVLNKNVANGYAGLDAGIKLAGSQVPYGSSAGTACEGNDARLSDARTPLSHNLGGAEHSADTLVNLNAKISDATLDDASSSRTPILHASTHDGAGSDAIAVVTALKTGLCPQLSGVSTEFLNGSGLFSTPAGGSSALPPNFVDGLPLSPNATNPTFQVDIDTGQCRDDSNASDIVVLAPITVSLIASGANGLDTGTEAVSTWYAVWLCKGASGVCGLFSLSSTTPVLPVGYDQYKRRLGWVRNGDLGDILNFVQYGKDREREYIYDEERLSVLRVLEGGRTTSTWQTIGSFGGGAPVPTYERLVSDLVAPTSTFAKLACSVNATQNFYLRPLGFSSSTGIVGVGNADFGDNVMMFPLTASREIEMYNTGTPTANSSLYMQVVGFKDYI